ncbi:hypothetical protein PAECIP112173_01560 [Paenibacillus sp. JJ-100]|uniref:DUF5412 family protein n=1 Tax=Paenibacillus sp. JJ-100 TaxID=2974896 RepID=UPI0022FF5F93|nr:DUF5412 family protein [Paenibacillus sp. JJ-100]CAI6055349.1 hypothetical protein PAECIP112173_01560 [Paenibacillus sp. JJ-100]
MRNKKNKAFWISGILVFIIVIGSVSLWNWYYDLERIPRGEIISESVSPDGKYTIKVMHSNAGATTSLSILCELQYNEGSNPNKTIYFQYKAEKAFISWESNEVVSINGIKLVVPDDVYDCRKEEKITSSQILIDQKVKRLAPITHSRV